MTGGLLAVHAHPDDETLSTGALLATWAAAGLPVTLVTCTRGEQGEVIPPALAHLRGAALAEHRMAELAAALRALGVRDHHFLDDPAVGGPWPGPRVVDSGMAWVAGGRAGAADDVPDGAFVTVPTGDAARRLAALLLERAPAVVVGYEPGGGYGHPDHVRAHEVMTEAVRLAVAGGLTQPVVLWSVLAEGPRRAAAGTLRSAGAPAGLVVLDPDDHRPSALVDADRVDVRVPVAPVLDRVLAALRAHETQVQAVEALDPDGTNGTDRTDGNAPPVARLALSDGVVQPVLAEETYVRAAGDLAAVGWPAGVLLRVA